MSGIDHNFANVQNGLDKMQDFKIFKTKWKDFVYHWVFSSLQSSQSFSSKSDLQFLREFKFKKDKKNLPHLCGKDTFGIHLSVYYHLLYLIQFDG